MKKNNAQRPATVSCDKVELSVQIDSELVEQLQHLTNDPSKVVEVALKQWLRREMHRDEEAAVALPRNPPLPPRGEWND
jgi:post-segregation antitoxin (ccd killing protein)